MSKFSNQTMPVETVSSILQIANQKFEKNEIENGKYECRVLMASILTCEQSTLISNSDKILTKDQTRQFNELVDQRLSGKPLHRILGHREFYGREFELNKDALEPRSETELLIDLIVKEYIDADNSYFCEIGVGSGILSVTLLIELAQAHGVASDISQSAIECAKTNAKKHGVIDRLKLIKSDCFLSYSKTTGGEKNEPFDFIVSNPPYIKTGDIELLSREVREHDPHRALDGGVDGLMFYRSILEQGREFIETGGKLYLETGYDQHEEIISIAKNYGWELLSQHKDINGNDRVVTFGKI